MQLRVSASKMTEQALPSLTSQTVEIYLQELQFQTQQEASKQSQIPDQYHR